MNIVYVTKTNIPAGTASSLNIVQTCNAMSHYGASVILFCPIKPTAPFNFIRNLRRFYGFPASFKTVRFPQLSREGKHFYTAAVKYCYRREGLLYSRDASVLADAVSCGLKCMWECHGMPTTLPALAQAKRLAKSPMCLRIIAISKSLADRLIAAVGSVSRNKVIIVQGSVEPARFAAEYACKPHRNRRLSAGYMGSFMIGKGWEILPELACHCPLNRFHIFGNTSQAGPVARQRFNAVDNLVTHGYVRPAELPRAMNTFDIGLLPNRPNVILANSADIGQYTSPMKLFEYMAAGKVVVASDLPVLREVLQHEVNALLVKYDNLSEWRNAVERLDTNRDLYSRLRSRAYSDAVTRYSYLSRIQHIFDA